jgi:selenide,water dikinase
VAGGHTIRSDEPIFGLAVQGLVDPDHILTKGGASAGDVLVLSKPIGTGIVLAGGTEVQKAAATLGMRQLNRTASESLVALGDAVHGATDVTGYGIAGHGWEVAERSGSRVVIDTGALPLYDGALAAARAGTRTGGDARNRTYLEGHIDDGGIDDALAALCFDPQTSGGLLAAVDPAAVSDLPGFTVIGEVADGAAGVLLR